MTGLESLRDIAKALRGYSFAQSFSDALDDIAQQIKREQSDDHEIAEWVRERGGLDVVKEEWKVRSDLKQELETLMKKLSYVDKLAESYKCVLNDVCKALGLTDGTGLPEMGEIICAELDKRLMPPGMEWPRFEDGEKVEEGDEFVCWCGDTHVVHEVSVRKRGSWINPEEPHSYGVGAKSNGCHSERVKRPKQDPIGADGLPVKNDETVYDKNSGDRLIVGAIEDGGYTITCRYADLEDSAIPTHGSWSPCDLTHNAPVIATDGKPLSGGETVWGVNGATYRVTDVHDGKVFARHIGGSFGAEVESAGGSGLYRLRAEQLTHERPDSWERFEEKLCYVLDDGDLAHELTERAKALAERDSNGGDR